jgi:dTDP-4-amino-4,6-dideoxygalactose transaminase
MKVVANAFDRLWADCQAEVMAAVAGVGASGWWILGPQVIAFEKNLAGSCGLPHAVGCANGMDAIEIALRASGIGPGSKVLTTPLSAFATALAILRAGAEPVFADVDEHGLLDPKVAEAALAAHPDIRAVIPVHLYGHLADTPRFAELSRKAGAVLIEDAAQAIGATRNGIRVGQFGAATCLSFYPTKNLGAMGDGGALLTGDDTIDRRSRTLRNYGQSEKYIHTELGLNSRLDELHAAVLKDAFLPKLAGWTNKRRTIARTYLDQISNAHVACVPGPDPAGSVWHLFPVLVAASRRTAFADYLQSSGVQANLHYPVVIPDQEAITKHGPALVHGSLDRARMFATCEVSLPIHPYLEDAEVAYVVDVVNGWAG